MIGPIEFLVILGMLALMAGIITGVVVLAVWLVNRNEKGKTGALVSQESASPPPVAGACPRCGQPLGPEAPHGLCARCVLAAGFDTVKSPSDTQPGKPAPPSCEEIARQFPRFEVLGLLGHGGMGAVYKVRQKDLDRVVALKVLPPQVGRDPAFTRRFASEARALARISHPNIIGIHEFGEAGGFFFFVMEYVDGMNLRQAMSTGVLKPEDALKIVPQVCEALQHAHNQGIVHRDIKPENILIDKEGRVRIADFGLARLVGVEPDRERITQERDVMGTPQYMAPEQTERPLQVDHRADIFSLGVVFYEMLTGQLPLGRFPTPSQRVMHLDVRLDEVVLRAIERDPERRYQRASEVKTDVESISHGEEPQEARKSASRGTRSEALRQLKVPALGLVISSLLGPFMVGFLVAIDRLEPGSWMFLPLVLQLALTALAAYGGLKALRLEAHRSAMVGGVAGCIVSFLNLFCLPFAVWFLAVLTRPAVKRAFVQTAA